jgi:hypothetical protein
MPQIDCTPSLLKDGAFPVKHDGRFAQHPNLSHGSLLTWPLALARKEKICRALNTNHSTIEYVGVGHGGF